METRQSDLDSTVTTLSQQMTDQQLHTNTTNTNSSTTAVDTDTADVIQRLEAKLDACIVSHDDKIIKIQVYIILVNFVLLIYFDQL